MVDEDEVGILDGALGVWGLSSDTGSGRLGGGWIGQVK